MHVHHRCIPLCYACNNLNTAADCLSTIISLNERMFAAKCICNTLIKSSINYQLYADPPRSSDTALERNMAQGRAVYSTGVSERLLPGIAGLSDAICYHHPGCWAQPASLLFALLSLLPFFPSPLQVHIHAHVRRHNQHMGLWTCWFYCLPGFSSDR